MGLYIRKQTINMRKPITSEEKIAITLRFLGTVEPFHSFMYQFWVHRVTNGKFVPEICKAIYHCLKDEYLKIPSTNEEWAHMAFSKRLRSS